VAGKEQTYAALIALFLIGCEQPKIEEIVCADTVFSTGYMIRLPHEPHAAERCIQLQRRALPREAAPDVKPFLSPPIKFKRST